MNLVHRRTLRRKPLQQPQRCTGCLRHQSRIQTTRKRSRRYFKRPGKGEGELLP